MEVAANSSGSSHIEEWNFNQLVLLENILFGPFQLYKPFPYCEEWCNWKAFRSCIANSCVTIDLYKT